MTFQEWAARHPQAARELAGVSAAEYVPQPPSRPVTSEAGLQALVRLEAAATPTIQAFRNNKGVLPNPRGRPVRYGLANDSKPLSDVLKSADLIGWRVRCITAAMVGSFIAQFWSRECKEPGWHFTGTEEEVAQLNWHTMVLSAGGDSAIVSAEGSCIS